MGFAHGVNLRQYLAEVGNPMPTSASQVSPRALKSDLSLSLSTTSCPVTPSQEACHCLKERLGQLEITPVPQQQGHTSRAPTLLPEQHELQLAHLQGH